MVVVTRKGVRRAPVRRLSEVVPPTAFKKSGATTIALPGSFRLEDYPVVGKRKVYLIDERMWDYLISSGWRPVDYVSWAARRLLEDAGDVQLYEVRTFVRDVVLERRRRYGSREYVDSVIVRLPWADRITEEGWAWDEIES